MQIRCVQDFSALEPSRQVWDELAGDCVFRSWTWQSTWWKHYGGDGDAKRTSQPRRQRRLYVLVGVVGDNDPVAHQRGRSHDKLVAVLPCYVSRTLVHGRMLRWLGDGEVCSDHLGLLAAPQYAHEAASGFAEYLANDPDWDLADLTAVDADDATTGRFLAELVERGCQATCDGDQSCWSIELPESWSEFLDLQSKSHRKQLRQLERRTLATTAAEWHLVQNGNQFDESWDALIDLHQRRRTSLGENGCFASPSWAAFHRDVARRLLDEDRLRLSTLEIDGRPVAAEYHLAGMHTTFAYQGGVDPDRLDIEPGKLSTISAIKHALAEGHRKFDFLRGDEPYKQHWRAAPQSARRYRLSAPRTWPRLRQQTWAGARQAGRYARQLAGFFGSPTA